MLCRRLKRNLPTREDEYCRMTLERLSEYLCPLNPEVNPAILDGGQSGLRNSSEFGKLALAKLLELAKDTDRLAYGDFNSRLGRTKLFHFRTSYSREG